MIYTIERFKEGYYPLKIVASLIAVDDTSRQTEHAFNVFLVDRCKQEMRGLNYEKSFEEFYTFDDTLFQLIF